MSARLPGYYIFQKCFTLFNFIVCTNFDRRLFFATLKINTGLYLPKSKAFNISFPSTLYWAGFSSVFVFFNAKPFDPGLIVWPSTRRIASVYSTLFFSSLFSFLSSKKVLIMGGTEFIFVCLFLDTNEIIWVEVFLFKLFTCGAN